MGESSETISKIQSLINEGAYFQAHNLAREAIESTSRPPMRLFELLGIALNKLGQPDKTISLLTNKYLENTQNSEIAGILAKAYKDRFLQGNDHNDLQHSFDIYYLNFAETKNYYTGINAATLALILENNQGTEIADSILNLGLDDDYWSTATKAEALLIKGEIDEAINYYRRAINQAGNNWGQLNSTKGQLKFIAKFKPLPEEIFSIFPEPNLCVFTGHMIDHPSRETPRFPPGIEKQVRAEIRTRILEHDFNIGFCSIACGSDILFIEVMKELGREVRLFLPFHKEDFLKTSVTFAGAGWERRFNNIVDNHHVSYITTEHYLNSDNMFHFMGEVMMGNCYLNADLYNSKPYLFTVLSNTGEFKTGGTSDLSRLWPDTSRKVNINPTNFINAIAEPPITVTHKPTHKGNRKIRYILFADIVGFSRLNESETPLFIRLVLQKVREELNRFNFEPEVLNTWGDALFLVHDDSAVLSGFAVGLSRVFSQTNWEEIGLPPETQIRIALHGGPVFIEDDPVTGNKNAYGTHVNTAARMEPITTPGAIYSSEQFAACLRLQTDNKYNYIHVGIVELPKNFGRQEIYRITPKNSKIKKPQLNS